MVLKFFEGVMWWIACVTNLIFLPKVLAGREVKRIVGDEF